VIAEFVSSGSSIWQLLSAAKSVIGSDVISGLFKYDGTLVEGSNRIRVSLHPNEADPAVWWFLVEPLEDYTFLRAPVNPSAAIEVVGTVVGERQPDAQFWRWTAPVLPGRIYGGGNDPPNLKVDFLVYRYRPKAMLKFGKRDGA